ncbi:putative lipid-transfer protein DIR1 [Morella rubra]|uniref:Putative lipid-transfer protein DIR1 n=1 Tax=Morella rubra TaxID=262757 RepID=A0A6A1WMW2_9ROSI|nr:putative lipid-transfer protein DIR1 [Morella rubra]KAB1224181.1 putative lipid-transfer protein DIR1 [Morella rubra]
MEMGRKFVVFVVLMVLVFEVARAVTFCNMNDDGINACKPSVTAPNPTEPTKKCCKALSRADLTCLCSYKNSILLPSLGIDPNLAMGLPAKCNLTPPDGCT